MALVDTLAKIMHRVDDIKGETSGLSFVNSCICPNDLLKLI